MDENTNSNSSNGSESGEGTTSSDSGTGDSGTQESESSSSDKQEVESPKTEDKVNDNDKQQQPTKGDAQGTKSDEGESRRDTSATIVQPSVGTAPSASGTGNSKPVFKAKGPGFQHRAQRKRFERDNSEGS